MVPTLAVEVPDPTVTDIVAGVPDVVSPVTVKVVAVPTLPTNLNSNDEFVKLVLYPYADGTMDVVTPDVVTE